MSARPAGGCACGAVRYHLAATPMFVNCCHCRACQRETGSAFVVNAAIETRRIMLERAAPVAVGVPTESGRPHDIHRCPACGTALWSDYGARRHLRFLRAGTLDDPAALPPQAHIFTRSRLPWVTPAAGVPCFEAFYDIDAVWPLESRVRRAAAMGLARPAS